MSKTFLIFLITLFVFQSCSVLKPNKVPAYTNDEARRELIEARDITLPQDTTKTIVVYNVIEKDERRFKISDETIRMFIADMFGTITTILTIRQIDKQP